ncbi:hypothetical protein M438DRAFT_79977 [Aureobasidium pullulans EXF-150]|uniref:F-box domain-containing protein n=1 Tax=Aureobasidium pullulans EXF-150 TaxID=1043002 RepID=A0A074XX69_AURPU|nr:uncharacterized protein M438DRAFT_79977 [Aureobasidium pullulans EXF-150]KEQ88224.1 hypothetical protein M438DRAFT_79977 [Aureobasidium pullulans EXF-150]
MRLRSREISDAPAEAKRPTPFRFLELPLEIRDSIYTYYCATTRKRSGRDRLYNNTHHTDLLRANRQIYSEAVNYLYDRTFSIYIVCEKGNARGKRSSSRNL